MLGTKIHKIDGYIQSIYLIQDKQQLALLDGCCSCDFEVVKRYIEEDLDLTIGGLKLVVSTHAHPDHMGALSKFKTCGAQIAGPSDLNKWYDGFSGLLTYCIDILLSHLVAAAKRKAYKPLWFPRKIDLDFILEDGDVLPGFKDWKVLECHGHTSMDLSLYNEKNNIAYIADNLVLAKKAMSYPYPICFPVAYKKSLQRYLDLGVNEFLLAHYGRVTISNQDLKSLIDGCPGKERNHRNTILKILIKLIRNLFTKK